MRNVIMFSGAGGTGKTTLAKDLETRIDATFHPSIVRDKYKELGLKSETELAAMREEERYCYQLILYQTYLEKFNQLATEEGVHIFDRSPLDHLGYIVYYSPSIEMDTLQTLFNMALPLMKRSRHFFYCPYPNPFVSRENLQDQFRYIKPGKEIMWDGFVQLLLRKVKKQIKGFSWHEVIYEKRPTIWFQITETTWRTNYECKIPIATIA